MANQPGMGILAPVGSTLASLGWKNYSAGSLGLTAAQDWQNRISGPGVVWYHNFDSAAEVNMFRWSNTVGDDPLATGRPTSPNCAWISSGGADGGGYLRIRQLAASNNAPDWIRPFSPLVGGTTNGNGRGVGNNDPGMGTLTPQAWNPTQGGSANFNWNFGAKPGWWGHPSQANSFFDSGVNSKFYLQIRIKTDPNRTFNSSTTYPNQTTGKSHVFTAMGPTSIAQAQVVLQCFFNKNIPIVPGMPNYHNAYSHGQPGGNVGWGDCMTNPPPGNIQIQMASDLIGLGICSPYNNQVNGCWAYNTDGSWDTLEYEITPSTNGGTGHIKVWAQHQGQFTFTKIWDFDIVFTYEQGTQSNGAPYRNGWNALWLAAYNNADPFGASTPDFPQYDMSFDQIVFSRDFIPFPQGV